jgi:ureidoglycolate lyase/seryl-tRNA synthetase
LVTQGADFRFGARAASSESFVFTPESFPAPTLPANLTIIDVKLEPATNESLKGLGGIVDDPNEFTTEKKTFEVAKWPLQGWRQLDLGTGDEAGTTEGDFHVWWQGNFFYGKNLAIATSNNFYLDGLGALPENAKHKVEEQPDYIYLWMSDYHPDGGQLFWPHAPTPFVMCLGPASKGDDIKPEDMRAFLVPAGKGAYIHPGTWHNGFYVAPEHTKSGPVKCLTRQGKVHARVSASWAHEFGKLLKVPLK